MDADDLEQALGRVVTYRKTVAESDIYAFAGVTGDLSPNHVDRVHAQALGLGERVAHGVLLLGYASTCSTRLVEQLPHAALSYGYDRVRFTKAVTVGETITVELRPVDYEAETAKLRCDVRIVDEAGDVCLVATHILKMLTSPASPR